MFELWHDDATVYTRPAAGEMFEPGNLRKGVCKVSGISPQQRSLNLLTSRGYLCASVERRKSFPDRKKHQCKACGHVPLINISVDLFNVFDIIALNPLLKPLPPNGGFINRLMGRAEPAVFVQTTSRNNHSTRRNKILASMEAKLVLLSGARIVVHSWKQEDGEYTRWKLFEEEITIDMYAQAPHYPNSVAELVEIKRKQKLPDLPPHTTLFHRPILDSEVEF